MASCLTILADGFESVEAIAPVDILRRGGFEVTLAGLGRKEIVSAQGITVVADTVLTADMGLYDLIFLPGGMPGSVNLAQSVEVIDILKKHVAADKYIAAICAAPAKILGPNGVLDGKTATCYPGNMDELLQIADNVVLSEEKVVRDGNIFTSRGVGTALELGFTLVGAIIDEELAEKLRIATVYK